VGVRFVSGGAGGVRSAGQWRDFWRERGMRELLALIGSAWPPLADATVEAADACAFRIASLLGSRAPREAIAGELARIRRDELGLAAEAREDHRAAGRITDWFAEAAAS
jgi:hypothetical protein